MTATDLFSCTNLWVERSGQAILQGLSVTIPAEGITCLVGASGSGKSTLLRLLNRLDDPTRGSIAYRGQELSTLDPLDLRRRVALVLQTPVMLPGTVRENLEAGHVIRGRRLADPGAWLERVGLSPALLEKTAKDLSGGEKQRVSLARSLSVEPEALLLDEVTASLDQESAHVIERLIVDLGLPAVWISHDPAQVSRVAARVLHMEAGRLREEVTAQ